MITFRSALDNEGLYAIVVTDHPDLELSHTELTELQAQYPNARSFITVPKFAFWTLGVGAGTKEENNATKH